MLLKKKKIEETGRRGRRSKQRLDDIKGTRRYWKLKEDALDGTLLWKTRFGNVMDQWKRDYVNIQNYLHSKIQSVGKKE